MLFVTARQENTGSSRTYPGAPGDFPVTGSDGDRMWASVCATYRLSGHMAVNLAYSHVFVASEAVNRVSNFYPGTPAHTTVITRSHSTGDADILAFSLSTGF